MRALEQVRSFREAVGRFPKQGLNAITLDAGRLFQSLFQAELQTLLPGLQKTFLKLSILPAPFVAEIAQKVCRASLADLQALAKTPFLQQVGDTFVLTDIVRDCAWKLLDTSTCRRLRRRLALFCVETLAASNAPSGTVPAPFTTPLQAEPFLRPALQWILEQSPQPRYLGFIDMLRHCGLNDLALIGISYLQSIGAEPSFPPEVRLEARVAAAYMLMAKDRHVLAVIELEAAVPIAEALPTSSRQTALYGTLMMTCHYAGDSERAVGYGLKALTECRLHSDFAGEAHILRFLGEIHTHLGDFTQALRYCEAALKLRREKEDPASRLADALYWKAKSLFRLDRRAASLDTVTEALSLWQQEGDATGVAFCLRLLGQVRCAEGQVAEAQAHLEHAVLIHGQTGIEVNRIAALEVLGDVFHAARRYPEARTLFQECLSFYEVKSHTSGIDRLKQKL